ncbi:MAG TPA: delta-lactam-biosynthetic de-N-acetylase [Virgibacillus sp.]|nr:delta-lactam-biosynthetic de-N-acetylase [Virgibacillus sp.]
MRKNMLLTSWMIIFLFISMSYEQIQASSGFGWGYKKNANHEVPEVGKYKALLEKYGAYYVDHSGEKNVYLTFDNGYEQGYTDNVLTVLEKQSVPATFFVTGHYVKSEPDLVKKMVDNGHMIGNHSYHHPDFTTISQRSMKEELESLEAAVADVSDQKELKFMRPPKGTFNEETLKWSNELGYTHVFWSLAFSDWNTDKQKGGQYAFDQVIKQIHPGAIILLHTVSEDNAEALEDIIVELKEQGYHFKSLDDLILQDQLPKGIYHL